MAGVQEKSSLVTVLLIADCRAHNEASRCFSLPEHLHQSPFHTAACSVVSRMFSALPALAMSTHFFLPSALLISSRQLYVPTHADEVCLPASPFCFLPTIPPYPLLLYERILHVRKEGNAVNNYRFNMFISVRVNNFLKHMKMIL